MRGVEQGTDHWHNLRIGRITASRVANLLGIGYDSQAKGGRDLQAVERDSIPDNKYMKHGRDNEHVGVDFYASHTGQIVDAGGFWVHPKYSFAAASPDGIVDGGKGGIEVKCPYVAPYGPAMRLSHWAQCQHQISCCEFNFVDYVMTWILREDDPCNPQSFFRVTRVLPSKWWDQVAGPEILNRYTHCVVNRGTLPRLKSVGAKSPDLVFRRLNEEAWDAMTESTRVTHCTE